MHSPGRRRPLIALLLCAAGIAGAAGLAGCRPGRVPGAIERRAGEIEFSATVHPTAFDRALMMPGYHAVVGTGGRMTLFALLRAEVSDEQILSALEGLGGPPGNNLPMETWTERKNADHPAPDRVIAGPAVEVLLRIPGRKDLLPLSDALEDPGGRGLQMRLGGNRANIPKWKSGCVVCLYSCPGSKVGNARYTVRDYERGVTRFRAKREVLPKDGTRVGIVLRLAGSRLSLDRSGRALFFPPHFAHNSERPPGEPGRKEPAA